MSDNCPEGPTSYPSDCQLTEGLRKMAANRSPQETIDPLVRARAEKLALLLLDVDGVLTDGTLFFSPEGEESKGFNTQDGFGISMLREAGVDVGVITARSSKAVSERCQRLQMRYVCQGERDKLVAYKKIAEDSGLKPFQIAYMGDDWLDLVLLKRVGLAVAPANSVAEVRQHVHYVTRRSGGAGAVREVCDLILQAKGLLDRLLQSYLSR